MLLIDRSASMAAAGKGGSPFDKARQQAGEILEKLPGGTAWPTWRISTPAGSHLSSTCAG